MVWLGWLMANCSALLQRRQEMPGRPKDEPQMQKLQLELVTSIDGRFVVRQSDRLTCCVNALRV